MLSRRAQDRRRVAGQGSQTRIIILTTFDLDEYVYAALTAGASGFLSETTVKTHVARILAKLDLRDRVLAVVFASETRLVSPGEGSVQG